MNDTPDQNIRETIPISGVNINAMIAIIDELSLVVDNENRYLKRGLPAPVSSAISRKSALASELESWVDAIRTGKIALTKTTAEVRQDLAIRGTKLDAIMSENSVRLQGAIVATRQRIDAIMRAARAQNERAAGYGKNGRPRTVPAPIETGSRLI